MGREIPVASATSAADRSCSRTASRTRATVGADSPFPGAFGTRVGRATLNRASTSAWSVSALRAAWRAASRSQCWTEDGWREGGRCGPGPQGRGRGGLRLRGLTRCAGPSSRRCTSRSPHRPDLRPPRWRACVTFGCAGWSGYCGTSRSCRHSSNGSSGRCWRSCGPIWRPAATGSLAAQVHPVSRPALYRRLESIQMLLDVDPDDWEQPASLYVALLAHEAQRAAGPEAARCGWTGRPVAVAGLRPRPWTARPRPVRPSLVAGPAE